MDLKDMIAELETWHEIHVDAGLEDFGMFNNTGEIMFFCNDL